MGTQHQMHRLTLGTAGHIDHGKTALVRALTGIDCDRLPQEKQRGITIDIGFAHLDLADTRVGIVDVPGHERFIRNMLAGAAGIDIALLVVAADDSVMPQTTEHLAILELLAVKTGLIAITKCDTADDDTLALVEDDIKQLVAGTFLENAPVVRTSARSGTGIEDLKDAIATACADTTAAAHDAPFRLAIDRSFHRAGLGTIVTGTVWSGTAHTGDELQWLPAKTQVRVKRLQSHGSDTDHVARGERAAVCLAGMHHTDVQRGHEIAAPDWLEPSRLITARIDTLAQSPWPIRHRARVRLHIGTQEVIAGVRLLRTNAIEPGASDLAQLVCDDPVTATGQQPFVIRSESPVLTIGGGRVLIPAHTRIPRNDDLALAQLDRIDTGNADDRIGALITLRADSPWTNRSIARDADATEQHAAEIIDQLTQVGAVRQLTPSTRMADDHAARLEHRVRKALAGLHEAAPNEASIPASRLSQQLDYLDPAILTAVLSHMLDAGTITGDLATSIALPDAGPKLTPRQQALRDRVLAQFAEAAYTPPVPSALAAELSVRPADIDSTITLCTSQGDLVHIGAGIYLHADAARALPDKLTPELERDGMTVSQIRTTLATTRKFAVPICEYLDRIRFTRRVGDVRVLASRSPEHA